MGEHTSKEVCPDCGAVVKVEAGKELSDVHKHSAAEKRQMAREIDTSSNSGKSDNVEASNE